MHIGFGKAYDIETHYRMKQDGDVYTGYLDDQKKRQIVDCVNADVLGVVVADYPSVLAFDWVD